MKANTLYYFALRAYERNDGLCFVGKTTLKNRNYALYALPVCNRAIIEDGTGTFYTRTSHHISIYAGYDEKDPHLSHYHYTAYFIGPDRKFYQLHAYFNGSDDLIVPVEFSLVESMSQTATPVSVDEVLSNQLSKMAISRSLPVMKDLRAKHHAIVSEVKKRYNEHDLEIAKLTAVSTSTNKERLEKYLEAIDMLTTLFLFDGDKQYGEILTFYTLAAKNCEEAIRSAAAMIMEDENMVAHDLKDSPPTQARSNAQKKKKLSVPPTQSVRNKQSILPELNSLEEAQAKFRALANEQSKEKTNALMLADDLASIVYILQGEKTYHVSQEEKAKIADTIAKQINYGKQWLTALIIKKQFDLALKLRKYTDQLSPDVLVKFALAKGDAEMLEFLLKQGMSLDLMGNDGLPITYHIASDYTHPLYKFVSKHFEVTGGPASLYQMLLKYLKIARANESKPNSPIHSACERYRLSLTTYLGKISPGRRVHIRDVIGFKEDKYAWFSSWVTGDIQLPLVVAQIKREANYFETLALIDDIAAPFSKLSAEEKKRSQFGKQYTELSKQVDAIEQSILGAEISTDLNKLRAHIVATATSLDQGMEILAKIADLFFASLVPTTVEVNLASKTGLFSAPRGQSSNDNAVNHAIPNDPQRSSRTETHQRK